MNEPKPWNVKIEKGVPMPARGQLTGVGAVLTKMEVGDSFVIPDTQSRRGNIYTSARKFGMKVSVRKEKDNQIRIWRIQ